MTDPKKPIPEHAQSNALSDDQLAEVVGGMMGTLNAHLMRFKYCAADPSHVYPAVLDACPECGCREYTHSR